MTRSLPTLLALAVTAGQLFASGETVTLPLGELPPGKTVVVTYSATVDRTLPAGPTTIRNRGTVSFGEGLPVATEDLITGGATDTDAFSTGPSIPITNFSFEAPGLGAGDQTPENPGWDEEVDPEAGFIQRVNGFSGEGKQHLVMQSGHIVTQVLPRSCYKPDTVYTLTVAVGNRPMQTQAGDNSAYALGPAGVPLGAYSAAASLDASTLPPGTFADGPPVVLDTGQDPSVVGQQIQICLGAFGPGPSHFDNVRLTEESAGLVADGPVAYYRFDEAPGALQATDSSGNGNHATYTNGATPTVEGVPTADLRTAATFDGDDDFIATPALFDDAVAMTFEGWLKTEAVPASGCCLSIFSTDSFTPGGLHLNTKPGNTAEFALAGSLNRISPPLPLNEWFHFASVFDQAAETVEFFVNGNSIAVSTYASTPPLVDVRAGQIGGWASDLTRNFTGEMDDVAIFDKALTAVQIKAHYEAAVASGPHLGEGTWAVREIYGSSILASDFTTASLVANDPFGTGGTVLDYQSASLNRRDSGGFGFFSQDVPFLVDEQTPQGAIDSNDDLFVLEARTLLRITEEDDYTFGFSSDEGAKLRVIGVEFTSSTSLNPSNPAIPAHSGDTLSFPGNTGNAETSDTLGVARLKPGVYELQFLTWEAFGNAYAEVFVARGARSEIDGSFRLVGDPIGTPPARANLPEILAPGFDVTAIYDGANTYDAAIDALYGHWSGDSPGTNVFTETSPQVNYIDPDLGFGGKGRPQTAFPGETPGVDDQNFAIGARAQMEISEAGTYTFLTAGDDGSQVRIKGTRGWTASGVALPLENGFRAGGGIADALGQVFLEPGTYTIELIWFEVGGAAHIGLFAASGFHLEFNGEFELLGSPGTTPLPVTLLPLAGPQPPPNDDFAKAFDLGSPPAFNVSGHTAGATSETGDPSETSIWFSWTAPSAAEVTLDTFGSTFDTVLSVSTGLQFAGLTGITSNDNAGSSSQSRVTFTPASGETYRIQVGGSGGVSGLVELNLAPAVAPVVPANDNFVDAADLGSGNWAFASGDTTSATTETGEPALGGGSVWFTWTAPTTGFVSLGSGNTASANIGVFTGTAVGSLEEVGVVGGGGDIFAVAGTTYQIALIAPGEFTLSLATIPEILMSAVDFTLGALALTWSSEPRQTYRVEVGTDLESFPFVLECEASEGAETTAVFEGLPGTRFFYRVGRE